MCWSQEAAATNEALSEVTPVMADCGDLDVDYKRW